MCLCQRAQKVYLPSTSEVFGFKSCPPSFFREIPSLEFNPPLEKCLPYFVKVPLTPNFFLSRQESPFCSDHIGEKIRSLHFPIYNLGQYKMEQLSPIPPKAMMKARRSEKRAILASMKWGEGWSRCSIYFVQDCRLAMFCSEKGAN